MTRPLYQHALTRTPPEAQEWIFAAAAKLGYRPHPLARGLRSGRTGIIGFVSNAMPPTYVLMRLLFSLDRAAAAVDHRVILATSYGEPKWEEKGVDLLLSQRVDGIVISHPTSAAGSRLAAARGVPTVALIPWFEVPEQICTVAVDSAFSGFLGRQHLLEQGHRRIGFIGSDRAIRNHRDRLEGCRSALAAFGIEVDDRLIRLGEYGEGTGYLSANALLDVPDPPTAIFVTSDASALGVLRALWDRRLWVPENVSVVSYDNYVAAYATPPLTTVSQPLDAMAEGAVRMVLNQLDGVPPEPRQVRFKPSLVVRDSTAPLHPSQRETA